MESLGRHCSEVATTCGLLLDELQLIWDEVGESDEERDQMLMQLELECLEVYRRKVNEANCSRAEFHQILADIHTEIVAVASELGDHPPMAQLENRVIPLKEQLANLEPILKEICRKKDERLKIFQEIRDQMQSIQNEISPSLPTIEAHAEEQDLTLKKLEELRAQLLTLQEEKNDRLYKVMERVGRIHDLCQVLDCDFLAMVREVHASLENSCGNEVQSISNETIERLSHTIQMLRGEKMSRMQQIQDLGTSLLELWNLLDTPVAEQHPFQHVTCNIAAAEHEFFTAGALSLRVIEQTRAEVLRLEDLKTSKIRELVLKKRTELEEICRRAHIVSDEHAVLDNDIAAMESGLVGPADVLASVEEQIGNIKEEAFSRKDVMDKIEKWLAACEEESWLDEYSKDENRYNTTRGAHLNLKRAERARKTISKIPALLESLVSKTTTWEQERGHPFLYDGVRLLSTIDEYKILRMVKEEDKRQQRDQKRLHEQLLNEQETLFGTRSSPNGRTPLKKGVSSSRFNVGSTPASSRRSSFGGAILQQESPAMPRMNGIIPGKTTSTPKKESRVKSTHIPSSVDGRLEFKNDTLWIAGAQLDDIPAQNALRVPLSPVITSGMRSNTNANMEAHSTSVAVKAAICTIKNPLSRTPTTVMDEENMPMPLGPAEQQPEPLPLQQRVSHAQQSREYSFEERRLAFMQEHQQLQHGGLSEGQNDGL